MGRYLPHTWHKLRAWTGRIRSSIGAVRNGTIRRSMGTTPVVAAGCQRSRSADGSAAAADPGSITTTASRLRPRDQSATTEPTGHQRGGSATSADPAADCRRDPARPVAHAHGRHLRRLWTTGIWPILRLAKSLCTAGAVWFG